jgi:hypothetical protein
MIIGTATKFYGTRDNLEPNGGPTVTDAGRRWATSSLY